MDEAPKAELRHLQEAHAATDPLTVIMTAVSHKNREGVEKLLRDAASTFRGQLAEKQYDTMIANSHTQKHIGSLFPLYYNLPPFNQQSRPLNGKFWNMIRPTGSCSSVVRLCEIPDGCRLVCNAEYLLHAGLTVGNGSPHFHRIAGFGSNNEYEWEDSLMRMFKSSEAMSRGRHHSIGWLTIFDCTLVGRRQWAPPRGLTESAIGFGHVTKCCDGEMSSTSVTIGAFKDLQIKSENERRQHPADTERSTGELVTRYRVAPAVLLNNDNVSDHDSGTIQVFDGLTILKLDIEGYEFNALPAWARDELRCLAEQNPSMFSRGDATALDFSAACREYFTVSLLNMEFHRSGHANKFGARLPGALRAHFTILHLYSLGFLMIGQERNHFDDCCYEVAFVHQRHLVKTEMWGVVRDHIFG
jgi:hypothetical protein